MMLSGALREHRPDQVARLKRQQIQKCCWRGWAMRGLPRICNRAGIVCARREGLLAVLTPEATLRRGYSITTDAKGKLIRSVSAVRKGMEMHTRLSDGRVISRVEKAGE